MGKIKIALALSTLLVTAAASALPQAGQLTPHVAEYKVKISVASGELRTELRQTPDGYVAIHSLVPKGISRLFADGAITEVARFTAADDAVTPVVYRSDDTLDDDPVHARIQFDWQANQASGTVNGEPLVTDLEALTHDRVSIQYALMNDLLNGRLDEHYRLFETDELRLLNVRSVGTRQIRVPAGRFEAIGIQHQAEGSSRATTLWCVEELGYLPVVIEQHRKGKLRVKATLKSYTTTAAASAEAD